MRDAQQPKAITSRAHKRASLWVTNRIDASAGTHNSEFTPPLYSGLSYLPQYEDKGNQGRNL